MSWCSPGFTCLLSRIDTQVTSNKAQWTALFIFRGWDGDVRLSLGHIISLLGLSHKTLLTSWLKQQKCIVSLFWKPGVPDQGIGGAGFFWNPSPWFADIYFLPTFSLWEKTHRVCYHSSAPWVCLCAQTFSSYKDNHTGFVVVQSPSQVWLSVTPRTAAHQAVSFTVCWSLLKLTSIESVMLCNHLILCPSPLHPLLLLPSVFASIRVFSSESVFRIRYTKYWSFSFSISTSNEYSELISLRIDWFNLLAVQGTLKSLLQHHNSKASIVWHSTFFMVQLSHPYMTTGKTIALTIWTFVSKVMSLLFNTLSRFVKTLHNNLILT